MANFFTPVVRPKKINEQLSVVIDKLDINGVGVARSQNKPIFVVGALPNEVVEVKVIEQKSKYARAKIITINKINDNRVTPKCLHFGVCGGCDLQMLSISAQLEFKQQKLNELFERSFSLGSAPTKKHLKTQLTAKKSLQKSSAKVKKIELPWQSPIQSEPWHYRRKARIGVQFDKNAQPIIGFRQKHTNKLTAIKSCPVLVNPVNDIFPVLQKLLTQLTVKAAIGHIEVIHAGISYVKENEGLLYDVDDQIDNAIILVIRQLKAMNSIDRQLWLQFSKQYCWHIIIDDGVQQKALQQSKLIEPPNLSYSLTNGHQINFASSDFIQINHQVNNSMINQALTWLNVTANDNLLDLFCGLGNFSLALAKHVKRVVGVEGVQVMVDKANLNAQLNALTNCQFHQADLNSEWLQTTWATQNNFDKVILDPARAGAEQAVKQIAKLEIPTVLYVSCDPATLARDSVILVAQGYKIEKISLIDMFSQTKHVETMVLFTL